MEDIVVYYVVTQCHVENHATTFRGTFFTQYKHELNSFSVGFFLIRFELLHVS